MCDRRFNDGLLWKTVSVCPVCQKRVPAAYVREGGEVFIEKTCDVHGQFKTVVWRGSPDICQWLGSWEPSMSIDSDLGCPDNCGICELHRSKTCCVVYEVTDRCNLCCPFCFL